MPTAQAGRGVIVDVVPSWPFRLSRGGGPDPVSRVRAGVYERFLHVNGRGVLVRAWERQRGRAVRIAAMPVDPAWLVSLGGAGEERAGEEELLRAVERVRDALGVDDDYGEFYARFRRDPLLGPAIRRLPWLRARRCAWPWESLAWAITEQLIEVERAHSIQRRIIARWGPSIQPPDRDRPLRDAPGPELIAGLAPAELAALDLAPKRALAMVKVAREVAAGRIDPARPDHDRRLLAISEIGPWTVQCLGQKGRGDPDSLPAGDLAYLKLVPRLAGMDRRATVEEVEEFYAPYAPYRGLAGLFTLAAAPKPAGATRPLRYHRADPEREAA